MYVLTFQPFYIPYILRTNVIWYCIFSWCKYMCLKSSVGDPLKIRAFPKLWCDLLALGGIRLLLLISFEVAMDMSLPPFDSVRGFINRVRWCTKVYFLRLFLRYGVITKLFIKLLFLKDYFFLQCWSWEPTWVFLYFHLCFPLMNEWVMEPSNSLRDQQWFLSVGDA